MIIMNFRQVCASQVSLSFVLSAVFCFRTNDQAINYAEICKAQSRDRICGGIECHLYRAQSILYV